MSKKKSFIMTFFKIMFFFLTISCTPDIDRGINKPKKSQLGMPVIRPNTDVLEEGQKVSIFLYRDDMDVYYTLDGLEPTVNSFKYNGEFSVTGSEVLVSAKAFKDGYIPSLIAKKHYRINSSIYLTDLSVSKGIMIPEFNRNTFNYAVNVSNETESIKLNFDSILTDVSYKINNVSQTEKSKTIDLTVGSDNVVVLTIEKGGKTLDYKITITRQSENSSNDCDLNNISLEANNSAVIFSPDFSSDVTEYFTEVEYSVGKVKVNVTPSDSKSIVQINNNVGNSRDIILSEGQNKVTVKITAEDGRTTKSYIINITQKSNAISSNAFLKSLTITGVDLEPAFDKNVLKYTGSVNNEVSSITINAEKEHENSKVEFNGKTSNTVLLDKKTNVILVKVTAEDNQSEKVYELTINKLEQHVIDNSNSNLETLTVSKGELSPAFSKSVVQYDVSVENDITEISFTAASEIEGASVKINGKDSPALISELKTGTNSITVTVTAKDGVTKKTYTVNVNRSSTPVTVENNANLGSLTFNKGELSPIFDKSITSYTLTVEYDVTSISVDASSEISGASVKIADKTSPAVISGLTVGSNSVNVVVTAKDGVNKKTYTINIVRETETLNDNNNTFLSSLTSDTGTITPGFDKNIESYSISVENNVTSLKLTAVPEISGASVKINGKASPASISDLAEGVNNIDIEVTAKNEINKKTYSVIVTRKKAPVTDKIILHAKNYSWVYLWATTDTALNAKRHKMTDSGNGWSTITLNVTSANIIFTPNDSWDGKTADLSRTAGEWWFMDNKFSDENPDGPKTPSVTASLPAGVYLTAQAVSLSSTNGSSDVIYYTIDGTTPNLSSSVYSSPITISSKLTLKAFAFNSQASNPSGAVISINYDINPNADLEPPTITASQQAGGYENPISVTFTIKDNKSAASTAYYTKDGSEPTTSSQVYTTGDAAGSGRTGSSISINSNTNLRFLVIDGSGNQTKASFYYRIGKVTTTRFDPRQETIYFLLTSRWFDGDPSNTVGDDWCSYTEERVTPGAPNYIADHGFTGPEDVSWRGDFKGLVEKMDYIKALGFTAIWITPVVQNRSPLAYHGYHGWDFTREDPRLESPGYDFQRVIDEAHARDMKICLDIVINHSGRYGIKNFAEVQYARDPALYPVPEGWENFKWDESRYKSGLPQNFPNGWQYDGLTSPGMVNGKALKPSATFTQNVRPFTAENIAKYPNLMDKAKEFLKFQWPSTESYCLTIDGRKDGENNSLTYEQYKTSSRRLRGHNTGFPTGSGSFDNFPDAHLDSLHEDCPDLNTENPDVQQYMLNAYYRYIDMGVDMFRVDTVMHIHKETLNEMYWPQLLARAEQSKAARGGADFFIFGEVANFVNNLSDKPARLQQSHYTWDQSVVGQGNSSNHLLNGNNYRTPDYSKKAPNASSPYHVSVLDIISHNGFVDGVQGAYGRALNTSSAYNDATYLSWYTDSHDYGPNKGETRWAGDFAGAWSMMFTFRGIPIVYYGSEIRFAAGKPNDWPGGGGNGVNMSLEKTGRSYFGPHLEGSVKASGFGEYTASGEVAKTLNHELSQHLMALNKIRLAVPALQMGQYSTEGHNGAGWAGFKRRYTGTDKLSGQQIDSYVLVGVGSGNHSWSGVLDGQYENILTGATVTASGGSISGSASGSGSAALLILVHKGLATPAPGKISHNSPFLE